MSQYTDAGLITTKPYISSSHYLWRMSDFPAGVIMKNINAETDIQRLLSPVYKCPGFIENKAMKARRRLDIRTVIRRLLAGQKLGVLATREPRSPYQNLVAFAVSRDLKHIYFATAAETRKHANLIRSPQVSMLFDNRSNAAADFFRGVAVTALGRADKVKTRSQKKILDLYLKKHPNLDNFVKSPSCRMFQVKVKTYIVVTEFQPVRTNKDTSTQRMLRPAIAVYP